MKTSTRPSTQRPQRRLRWGARTSVLCALFTATASPALAQPAWDGPLGPLIIENRNVRDVRIRILRDDDDVLAEMERIQQQLREAHQRDPALGRLSPQPAVDPLPTDEELAELRISSQLIEQIPRLDDPDYETREAAMKAVVEFPGENAQIYAVLAGHGLEGAISAEQHARLLAAVRERVLHAPRGALGIRMDTRLALERGWVEVTDLLPGLPAKDVLQVGDRIVAIEGRAIQTPQDLTTRIQSRAPGETLNLTVERRAHDAVQTLEVSVKLGSAELLTDPVTGQTQTSREVEENRRREMAAVEQRFQREPIRVELAEELPPLPRAPQRLGDRIEQHPAIRHIRLMQQGTIAMEHGILIAQLNQLRRERNHPALSDQDREYLDLVIERYVEIMNEL